jgi:hypothetical protein
MVDAAEDPASLETLLAELNPSTDLARLVERVWRNNLSRVVVSAPAPHSMAAARPCGLGEGLGVACCQGSYHRARI